ncbi:MAG: Fe(3+) ABC transporter substrate-binding protein [Alphaproteobacteria bacterium]|nr:Fe(3+) ABC transporter substrate-binding protein [Alphaproteobacteria bacterium]
MYELSESREVNVYSYRQPQLIEPIINAFTEKTGIKVRTIFASKGLIERVAAEGRNSPADLLLTVDISRLMKGMQMGVSQKVRSPVLEANIPKQFRNGDGYWFALSLRARVIYASRMRVPQNTITYSELSNPEWKGRVCTRSGQHSYSLGLISSVIAHEGVDKTRQWLRAVRGNLARKPSGNDRNQIKSIFSGECDIALGNTYYMGLMEIAKKDTGQRKWAKSVKILFPDANGRGTHVNVSGMFMVKDAPHPKSALKLMEFLSSEEAQRIYSGVNFEYPVNQNINPSPRVRNWGELKADKLPLDHISKHHRTASELVDEVGFDEGPY